MEFRRYLVANGVSPAGADEALIGLPVTNVSDQSTIRRLGYYVSPRGEVTPGKSLGPGSALPKEWLDLERVQALQVNYRARAAAAKATPITMQVSQVEQVRLASLSPVEPKPSHPGGGVSVSVSAAALEAIVARTALEAGKKTSADEARQAKIKKLELEIATLKAQIDKARRELEAELAKEIAILHLANPITFPFFIVLWNDWKRRVQALQAKLMNLITKLPSLYAELAKAKSA